MTDGEGEGDGSSGVGDSSTVGVRETLVRVGRTPPPGVVAGGAVVAGVEVDGFVDGVGEPTGGATAAIAGAVQSATAMRAVRTQAPAPSASAILTEFLDRASTRPALLAIESPHQPSLDAAGDIGREVNGGEQNK